MDTTFKLKPRSTSQGLAVHSHTDNADYPASHCVALQMQGRPYRSDLYEDEDEVSCSSMTSPASEDDSSAGSSCK
ncbi:hypothetical protein CFAM422_002909 [Trichoderma lentiforme]|uniref:Uncharacterized protein n=1 Tax=Trichoderma lentiforme TaxID=1567552 RepID=A0A9P4XKB1_9HYPO|nr:hypothetical protein CFAM422_002909 [Trichoderma lentiforme]